MIILANYTDSHSVRAVIGITENELTDHQMVAMLLEDQLLIDLAGWLPTHADVYSAGISALPGSAESLKYKKLRLYATYFMASRVDLFQLALPHTVSDGKNSLKRFEGVDFDELSAKLLGMAEKMKTEILGEDTTLAFGLTGIATPSYDPVTNV